MVLLCISLIVSRMARVLPPRLCHNRHRCHGRLRVRRAQHTSHLVKMPKWVLCMYGIWCSQWHLTLAKHILAIFFYFSFSFLHLDCIFVRLRWYAIKIIPIIHSSQRFRCRIFFRQTAAVQRECVFLCALQPQHFVLHAIELNIVSEWEEREKEMENGWAEHLWCRFHSSRRHAETKRTKIEFRWTLVRSEDNAKKRSENEITHPQPWQWPETLSHSEQSISVSDRNELNRIKVKMSQK